MTEIYVDADACPVKDEVVRVADRHGLPVRMVSDGGIRPNPHPLVEMVIVASGPDAADDWIAERIGPGDVAVTGDIPLAARCLEKGAKVMDTKGKPFTEHGIGMALAMRDLMSDLRAMGEVSGGGPGFTRQDRSRFLEALDRAVRR